MFCPAKFVFWNLLPYIMALEVGLWKLGLGHEGWAFTNGRFTWFVILYSGRNSSPGNWTFHAECLLGGWVGRWLWTFGRFNPFISSLAHLLSLIISFLKVIFSLLLKWDGYCCAYFTGWFRTAYMKTLSWFYKQFRINNLTLNVISVFFL